MMSFKYLVFFSLQHVFFDLCCFFVGVEYFVVEQKILGFLLAYQLFRIGAIVVK